MIVKKRLLSAREEWEVCQVVRQGDVKKVQCLLDNRIVPEVFITALQCAAKRGHLPIVQCILRHGANLMLNGGPMLVAAAYGGQMLVVKYLLNRGVRADSEHGDALIAAASQGHSLVVRFLLQSGVHVGEQDGFAMDIAACRGHHLTVKTLLDFDAEVSAGAIAGVVSNGHHQTLEVFFERNKVKPEPGLLLSAMLSRQMEVAKCLLHHAVAVDPSWEEFTDSRIYKFCVDYERWIKMQK